MTIPTANIRMDYAGNGSTVTFPYTYKAFANTDLRVLLTEDATGVSVTQTLTTHYTVSGVGSESGGNVVMVTAPPVGYTLTILATIANTQTTDLVNETRFYQSRIEDRMDKLCRADQVQAEKQSRSMVLPESEAGSELLTALPPLAERKGKNLSFDATTAQPTASSPASAAVSAAMEPVVGSASLALARSALGVNAAMFVNVKDSPFGATGDGATDETAAIQAAIDSISSGVVILPAGTYKTGKITGKSNVILRGMGVNKTILSGTGSAELLSFSDASYFGVTDMSLEGSACTHLIRVVTSAANVIRPEFRNLRLVGFTSTGRGISLESNNASFPVYFPQFYDVDIDGGTSAGAAIGTRVGIYLGGSGSIVVGPVIQGGRIRRVYSGIELAAVDTARGINISFDGINNGSVAASALRFTGNVSYNQFIGCRFEGSPSVEIAVTFGASASYNLVSGPHVAAPAAWVADGGAGNTVDFSDESAGVNNKRAQALAFMAGIRLGATTRAKLSYYDEGTWTPVIYGSTGAGANTYSVQAGRWTRVGNILTITARVFLSAKDGAMAGNVRISGLPFTSLSGAADYFPGVIQHDNTTITGGYVAIGIRARPNANFLDLTEYRSVNNEQSLPVANLSATSGFTFTITLMVQ